MHRPLIGLSINQARASWGLWQQQPAALVHNGYISHLQRAGADVVLIPPGNAGVGILNALDGLVFAGGVDVDPARYNADPHPRTDAPNTARDESEFTLYARARERDLPYLGICRGMQVMAVAEGGALHQHVDDLALGVAHVNLETIFAHHLATFTPGSRIAQIYDTTEMTVNSAHHQAVHTYGALAVTGLAEDGTVEVLERPGAHFALGVQWHPEMMDDTRLFDAFVAACRR